MSNEIFYFASTLNLRAKFYFRLYLLPGLHDVHVQHFKFYQNGWHYDYTPDVNTNIRLKSTPYNIRHILYIYIYIYIYRERERERERERLKSCHSTIIHINLPFTNFISSRNYYSGGEVSLQLISFGAVDSYLQVMNTKIICLCRMVTNCFDYWVR
jgi:hypothetical protein